MIHGIPVTLFTKVKTGEDGFGRPIYDYTEEVIEDVLVAPLGGQEVLDTLELTGRKASYQLAIPKGDTHIWEGQMVGFFNKRWRVVGMPTQGIEDLIPLRWNMKVKVESIDEN